MLLSQDRLPRPIYLAVMNGNQIQNEVELSVYPTFPLIGTAHGLGDIFNDADVQELTARAYFEPTFAANANSNSLTLDGKFSGP